MQTGNMDLEFDRTIAADQSGEQTAQWLGQIRQAQSQNVSRMRDKSSTSDFADMQAYAEMLQAAERCLIKLWMELQGATATPQSFSV